MRLFTAIEIPQNIKKQIYRQAEKFDQLAPVHKEQLHLTLRFIGRVDAELEPEIRAALRQIHFAPIYLQLTGCGFFPSIKHPQIFWVGLSDTPELTALKKSIDTALAQLLKDTEDRKFVPHITLFRFKKHLPLSILLSLNEDFNAISTEPFIASEFHLYSSELKNTGAVHKLLENFPLNP